MATSGTYTIELYGKNGVLLTKHLFAVGADIEYTAPPSVALMEVTGFRVTFQPPPEDE